MYKLCLVLLIISLPSVQAAEYSIDGSLNPSIEYDDNVFMSENNEESGTRYGLTPTLNASRGDENSNVSLSVGYRLERWSSVDLEDRDDPFARLSSSFNTERSQFGLNLAYAETATRDNAADDTGNFRTDSTQTTKTIAPSYSYQLTERDTLSANAVYTKQDYDSGFGGNDNELKTLTTDWMRQYTEKLSAGLSIGVYNYEAESTLTSFLIEHDNYNLLALLNYQITELWLVDGRFGMRKLESTLVDDFGFKAESSSSGSSLDVSATRQDETDSLTLGASQTLSPNSNGGVDEQKKVNVHWSRSLTETLTTSVSARYLESESQLNQKRKYYEFSPSIRWQFERDLGLNLAYSYRSQKEEGLLSRDAVGNSIMATLSYNWDGLRASR